MTMHLPEINGLTSFSSDEAKPEGRGLYRNGLKRALDVTLVLVGGIVVLPVVLILAFLVSRDGSPAFYWSERVGLRGRTFRMLKLRTMVPDADAQLAAHIEEDGEAAAEWAATQKLKSDPRITPFGALLRRTSLDELPQLWNVLIGDMSLVGPRPMMPSQKFIYPGSAYYALRPGVTGPWQVSDRNACAFVKRADFDRDYHRDLSFTADVRLLMRTVAVVLRGTGY